MTPDQIVEAVARALLESDIPGEDWDALEFAEPLQRADYLKQAQAAITGHLKALADQGMVVVPREPTEAMRKEAYHGPIVSWHRMIAAYEQSMTDEEQRDG